MLSTYDLQIQYLHQSHQHTLFVEITRFDSQHIKNNRIITFTSISAFLGYTCKTNEEVSWSKE